MSDMFKLISGEKEQTRRVLDLSDSLIASALSEKNPGSRCMRQDMPTNRFTTIGPRKKSARTRVTLNLICLLDMSDIIVLDWDKSRNSVNLPSEHRR